MMIPEYTHNLIGHKSPKRLLLHWHRNLAPGKARTGGKERDRHRTAVTTDSFFSGVCRVDLWIILSLQCLSA